MADSVQILQNDSVVKRIHGSQAGGLGRVRKGYSAVKPNSSIPSKYNTVVIDTSDRRGFQSTARRFNYDLSSHVTPAPNHYSGAAVAAAAAAAAASPSYGKRGTGGFASRTVRRTDGAGSAGPGPAGYGGVGACGRADFNRASATSSFHPPIAVPRPEAAGADKPAPNRYNTLGALAKMRENRARDLASVFRSTTGRDPANLSEASRRPGPGAYEVARAADRLAGRNEAGGRGGATSGFLPSGPRRPGPQPSDNPGPGAYDHEVSAGQRGAGGGGFQFPMQHYLCLSAPALPLPPAAPLPGPGQYEIGARPASRHYMSSSMFLSNTSRWGGGAGAGNSTSAGGPGPAHYAPEVYGKQSFAYNADRHWAV